MGFQFFDFLQPLYFKLEKSVASRQIPSVHEIPNRKKLVDFDIPQPKDCFDHTKWDTILNKYVVENGGSIGEVTDINLVVYQSISDDPNFDLYLEQLKCTDPTSLPEPDQLAFWMNTYNAFCISLLINNCYRGQDKKDITSINDLSVPGGTAVWDLEAGEINGQKLSLNHVEHNEIRKKWAEPAIHACIVCASASCPNLRREAFVGHRLKQQMDEQVRNWLQNSTKGLKFSDNGKRLMLSRIFLWFQDDFGDAESLRTFLSQHVEDEGLKNKITKGKYSIRYFEYSWLMNRK